MIFPLFEVSEARFDSLSKGGKTSITIRGRLSIDYIDTTVRSGSEGEPFHSALSLAEVVRVSDSTKTRQLSGSFGMKNFHLRWVPHELTADLSRRRPEICGRLLPIREARKPDSFRGLVTGGSSWFVLEYQHSTKWSVARDEVPTRVSQTISTKKTMLTRKFSLYVIGIHVTVELSVNYPWIMQKLSLCLELSHGSRERRLGKCQIVISVNELLMLIQAVQDEIAAAVHIITLKEGRTRVPAPFPGGTEKL
jgi:hypothetical protein